jgi:myo-inositol-1(or 4)-monophosphatase
VASQRAIREIVLEAFPDHDFLGEEILSDEPTRANPQQHRREFRWIVDPLDGTTNYVHQLRSYSVSVALEAHGSIVAATVYDPELDECYTAAKGCGARLNGEPISPTACRRMDQALVAASLSANAPRGSSEIARLVEVIHTCQALRRLGSAALNLCYVAQGCLDGYWATSVNIWDIAAGMLIVEEAGGIMTSLTGGPIDFACPWFAAAATRELHRELLEVLQRIPD